METTETMQMPALGQQGEPCHGCGSPLAADQRYCLECGQRRGEARVDYRQHLSEPTSAEGSSSPQGPQVEPQAAASPEPKKTERDYTPLAAVGGIAVLGLMLLVGVLIGKGNNPTTAPPAPIVVKGETGSTTAGTDSAGQDAGSSKQTGKSKSSGTGAKTVKGGLTGEAARKSEAPVQASTQDLEELNSQSGDAYADAIKRLPDRIATPGAPPPIDRSKAPGGGGGALTIK
jgi:hypothetical protein